MFRHLMQVLRGVRVVPFWLLDDRLVVRRTAPRIYCPERLRHSRSVSTVEADPHSSASPAAALKHLAPVK